MFSPQKKSMRWLSGITLDFHVRWSKYDSLCTIFSTLNPFRSICYAICITSKVLAIGLPQVMIDRIPVLVSFYSLPIKWLNFNWLIALKYERMVDFEWLTQFLITFKLSTTYFLESPWDRSEIVWSCWEPSLCCPRSSFRPLLRESGHLGCWRPPPCTVSWCPSIPRRLAGSCLWGYKDGRAWFPQWRVGVDIWTCTGSDEPDADSRCFQKDGCGRCPKYLQISLILLIFLRKKMIVMLYMLISGHPWIVFYTECPAKAFPITFRVTNKSRVPGVQLEKISGANCSSSLESSSRESEEQDDCGFVDALAAAISRIRISERKRSRLCGPASPVQPECTSNMKANLCTAFRVAYV